MLNARPIVAALTAAVAVSTSQAGTTVCGDPVTGSCCEANGTPGCDYGACCQSVCNVDPFCCDVEWDSICADEAVDICDNCNGPCLSGTILVPDDMATIQDAVDAACNGAEIVVAPGTYFETIDFLGRAVWLHSSDGPDVTIIDGTGNPHVVRCVNGEGADTVLEGFTITGGVSFAGGGMYNSNSSPTVRNCVFIGNTAIGECCSPGDDPGCCNPFCCSGGFGGGMANWNSSPTVVGCVFAFNEAYTNVPFGGPVPGEGGGMATLGAAYPHVNNCTFLENSRFLGGPNDRVTALEGPGHITNCIFGSGDEIVGNLLVSHSLIEGGYPGTGNIDADPMFVDPDNGDFRLQPGSPCIDAGDNSAVPRGVTRDLDGNRRFVAGQRPPHLGTMPIVDMGAYEYQPRPGAARGQRMRDVWTVLGVDGQDVGLLLSRSGAFSRSATPPAVHRSGRRNGAAPRGTARRPLAPMVRPRRSRGVGARPRSAQGSRVSADAAARGPPWFSRSSRSTAVSSQAALPMSE